MFLCLILLLSSATTPRDHQDASVTDAIITARNLTDAGEWSRARYLLEQQTKQSEQAKDLASVARLKAALAHYAVDRYAYYKADRATTQAAVQSASAAVAQTDDKQALQDLEQAKGQCAYWQALENHGPWGPPTEHFDRAMQLERTER